MEIWKDIAGYDGYQVSSLGNIRSFKQKPPKIRKLHRNLHSLYWQVWLYQNHKKHERYVHRLVALAFIPNPENKPQVNHINGDKLDNRVENLEWVTAQENQLHAVATGLKTSGEDCKWAKLTSEQVCLIRSLYKPRDKEFGIKALAKRFCVGFGTIQRVVHGESHKNAGGELHKLACVHATEDMKSEIRRLASQLSQRKLAKMLGVSRSTVARILQESQYFS